MVRSGPSVVALVRAIAWRAGVVVVVVTWALAIGRYGGPDEPAHVVRAAAVGGGELGGDAVPTMASGFRVVDTPGTLATGTPSCFRHDARITARCAAATSTTGDVPVATAAGINPPVFYAAIGAPVRWLGDAGDTTWYRLVGAAWTSLIALLAIGASRPLPRGQRLAFAIVLPPAAWFLGGVVNPSTWEIGACLLAWIGVARIMVADRTLPGGRMRIADAAWFALPAAVAIAVRPVALLWVLTMAAVLVAATWRSGRWSRSTVALAALPSALALAGVAIWNRWIGLELTDAREASSDGLLDRIRVSLGGTRATLHEMVGSLGWAEFGAPGVVQAAWWLGAIGLAALVWRSDVARSRRALGVWACGLVLGPVAFEAATADDVGYIWQGRYSIAAFVGLAALVGPATARPWPPIVDRIRRRVDRIGIDGIAIVGIVLAIAELGTFWAVLRRYTVGSAGSWWLRTDADAWDPAVPARWLLAIHAVVLVGMTVGITGAVAVRSRRARQVM